MISLNPTLRDYFNEIINYTFSAIFKFALSNRKTEQISINGSG